MKPRVIHINGRGGSGKSTLERWLNEYFGWEKFKTCTTRSPRYEGESDYYFLDEDTFLERIKNNEILEMYFRKSNQSFYGAPAPSGSCIVQAEIMAHVALKKWCFQNSYDFVSIYLHIDDDVLLERLRKRNDPNESPEDRLWEDLYYEEFRDWSDVIYDYSNKTITEGVQDLIHIIESHFWDKTASHI